MVKKNVKIENKLGLHARPATLIVKTASKFKSNVNIKKDDIIVNGKSIMGVMMLAAEQGSEIEIICEGEDEKEALDAISKVVEDKFYEE
ncbi:HPr family phosphocarrier protein [candidate division WOR-3 bacterium]|uniref:Phosphocarrier protein HPr n=1 Tax=candidate division TA06 bacterium TaxID=2250710 RepID=A0A660S8J2_UNCT6|nr:HPr family phosphocarrier protein [candidate division WOR-3 bacterium]RKX66392.1 MAG: phosphocarrier protein HPr [candidate division TA06 bacterium]